MESTSKTIDKEPNSSTRRTDKDVHRFGRWAETYDQSFLQGIIFGPVQRTVLREIKTLEIAPKSILDVGCGTGRFLRMAAQNFPEARLIGTDASKEMVEVARSLNELPDSIHFFHSTAEDLSFPNSSIDVAMTTLSFHHWSDQEVALKGIQKKLRPNGIFILGDIMASGILQPIFALANHGRFNTVRKLEEMIGNAGLKIKKDIPLRRYGGTIRIIVSTKG